MQSFHACHNPITFITNIICLWQNRTCLLQKYTRQKVNGEAQSDVIFLDMFTCSIHGHFDHWTDFVVVNFWGFKTDLRSWRFLYLK